MKCFPRLPLAYGLLDMRGVIAERFAYTNNGHLLEMTSLCHDLTGLGIVHGWSCSLCNG
jgi:hypothetical protein